MRAKPVEREVGMIRDPLGDLYREQFDDGSYAGDSDLVRPFTTYVVLVWERDADLAYRYAITMFDDYGRNVAACNRAFIYFRGGIEPEGIQLKPMRGRAVFDGHLVGKVEKIIPWGFYDGAAEDEIIEVVHGVVVLRPDDNEDEEGF